MPWTAVGATLALDAFFRGVGAGPTLWAALFVGDPSGAGVELSVDVAPAYARQQVTAADWVVTQEADAARATSTVAISFPIATPGRYTVTPDHVAVMTAAAGGDVVIYETVSITAPRAGSRVQIPLGSLIGRARLRSS